MDLFRQLIATPENILPEDGIVKYYGILVPIELANQYFYRLLENLAWKNDEVIISGRRIVTKRKIAWYADHPFEYTYSKTTKRAQYWTDELLELKTLVENITGEKFNSCLANLYHNGSEGMAWHSDKEQDLKKNGAIGSLSFGVERKFSFRHNQTNKKISLILEHGSLLVMQDVTQTYWQHCLPATKKITAPRINLTFRCIEKRSSKLKYKKV